MSEAMMRPGGMQLVPGARYWVQVIGATRTELLTDLAQSAGCTRGWLAGAGGLLINLRVWENVLLPSTYFGVKPCLEDARRLEGILASLGIDDCEKFWGARVDSLGVQQRPLIVALRTLMSKPSLILAESEWFVHLTARQTAVLSTMFASECAGAAWVVAGNHAPAADWGEFQRIEVEDESVSL
jgi:ABC-type lipoprotein export system ATPase subunit